MNLAFTKTEQSEDQRAMPRQGPAMIDNIPALAWSCLPDGINQFLNQPWLDYKGPSFEEALGRRSSAIHPEDLRKLVDPWLALLVSGEQEDRRIFLAFSMSCKIFESSSKPAASVVDAADMRETPHFRRPARNPRLLNWS